METYKSIIRRAMADKSNPLNIGIGDIVEIRFEHHRGEPAFGARVTGLVERFRHDLIHYDRLDGVQPDSMTGVHGCSVSHVSKLIQRAYKGTRVSQNLYFENKGYSRDLAYSNSGSVYVGSPANIARGILTTQFYANIPYGIDGYRLNQLWIKDGFPGFLKQDHWNGKPQGWYHLRKKTFTRWVLANISRFRRTKEEWIAGELCSEEDERRSYSRSMDMELERDGYGIAPEPKPIYYTTNHGGTAKGKFRFHEGLIWVVPPEGSEFKVGDKIPPDYNYVPIHYDQEYENYLMDIVIPYVDPFAEDKQNDQDFDRW